MALLLDRQCIIIDTGRFVYQEPESKDHCLLHELYM